jgi:hypothetical protein
MTKPPATEMLHDAENNKRIFIVIVENLYSLRYKVQIYQMLSVIKRNVEEQKQFEWK